jgi:hypothetical protein
MTPFLLPLAFVAGLALGAWLMRGRFDAGYRRGVEVATFAAAWTLVDKLQSDHEPMVWVDRDGDWAAQFGLDDDLKRTAPTAPRAIALAALATLRAGKGTK